MASLFNYLHTSRKRLSLSQEEAAFLMGLNGDSKASCLSRYESFVHLPDLRAALACETIYGQTVRELFAGLVEDVEQMVRERAVLLRHRIGKNENPRRDAFLSDLIARIPTK